MSVSVHQTTGTPTLTGRGLSHVVVLEPQVTASYTIFRYVAANVQDDYAKGTQRLSIPDEPPAIFVTNVTIAPAQVG